MKDIKEPFAYLKLSELERKIDELEAENYKLSAQNISLANELSIASSWITYGLRMHTIIMNDCYHIWRDKVLAYYRENPMSHSILDSCVMKQEPPMEKKGE